MSKKKIKDLKDMTSEEILNGMKGVKITNLKDGDVLVGDGKGGMINKPLKEVEQDNLQKIIKLNEELTQENARLLTELECVKAHLSTEIEIGLKEAIKKAQLREELTSIKSKWWYKLMKWGW